MLTEKQISEIKGHLEKAQNPLFFFDNDPDGLCSFLILSRYSNKGKGVPIKSFPGLNVEYFRKVRELNSDYIFILDKPVVDREFFEEARKVNVPVVWIDHHEADVKDIPSFVSYYNPLFNTKRNNEPVTHLCYKISERKEDLWLDVVGCVSDRFVPEGYDKFRGDFPELSVKSENAFDILYKSGIGKIAKMFSFALKDRTTNVINMIRFLMKAKGPTDVLEENSSNASVHQRFEQVDKKYTKLFEKAISLADKNVKMLFFQYGGDLSISGELSNELSYRLPEKIIVVAYLTGVKANISVRGRKIREVVLKAIEGLEGARGGGHEDAVGAQVRVEDFEKFRENMEKLVG